MLDSAQEEEAVEPPVDAEFDHSDALEELSVDGSPWYDFLSSPRFWVMILGVLSVYLEAKGWIGEPERNLIASVSAIFITVRTIDRSAEKMGK